MEKRLRVLGLMLVLSGCSHRVESTATDLSIAINFSAEGQPIRKTLLGFNNSYFNDTETVWKTGDISNQLKHLGVGVMRYPGGEETSRFHWEHPGVNGYVDIWNEAPNHRNQKWQTTYVPPKQWKLNESFMDVDEYFAHCADIGAEPLLGVNMTAGEVNDRREDGLVAAVRLIEHCLAKGYPLTYVYLDNEPWHHHSSNYYAFPANDYAELCVLFSKALRAVNPKLKFVANPLDGSHFAEGEKLKRFLQIAGKSIDVLDAHWYWSWGDATFEKWASSLPLRNSSRWQPYESAITYTETINTIRNHCQSVGLGHLEIAALEWNVGNVKEIPGNKFALIQAEIFMQFMEGGLDMACVWPMFWQVNPSGTVRDSSGRSIFSHQAPYETMPSYDMFSLFSSAMGGTVVHSSFSEPGVVSLAYSHSENKGGIYLLNKTDQPIWVEIAIADEKSPWSDEAQGETLSAEYGLKKEPLVIIDERSVLIELLPYSLTKYSKD